MLRVVAADDALQLLLQTRVERGIDRVDRSRRGIDVVRIRAGVEDRIERWTRARVGRGEDGRRGRGRR